MQIDGLRDHPHIVVITDDIALKTIFLQIFQAEGVECRVQGQDDAVPNDKIILMEHRSATHGLGLNLFDSRSPHNAGAQTESPQAPPVFFAFPFRFRDLYAQIRRLAQARENADGAPILELDAPNLQSLSPFFSPCGARLRLTEKEWAMLSLLAAKAPAPVTREHLLEAVWGYPPTMETHTVETHIYRLRRKIADHVGSGDWIVSTPHGYRFERPTIKR